MLKTLHKSVLSALLLILFSSQVVYAERKLYKSDGNLPFVDMMLSMMSVMGIIDRVPANGLSGLSNPYARALAMRGLSPGSASGFGNNPFARSPWLQSPWSSSTQNNSDLNSASPVWGTPSWGVLPIDSYLTNRYSRYDSPRFSPVWSSSDLDGWVNEPWEISEWNPKAGSPVQVSPYQTAQPRIVQPGVPLVQNFYNLPGNEQQARQGGYSANNRSPLAKLAQPNRYAGQQTWQSTRPPARPLARPPATQQKKRSPLHKKTRQNSWQYPGQKPCITDFCGLKKPNLNGLWVAKNGEMLGVKNQRYLWSDGNKRHLTGQIKIQNEYLLTNVDDLDKLIRFKYKLAGDHLLTMKSDGTVREFVRMPVNQYRNNYYGSGQGYY